MNNNSKLLGSRNIRHLLHVITSKVHMSQRSSTLAINWWFSSTSCNFCAYNT